MSELSANTGPVELRPVSPIPLGGIEPGTDEYERHFGPEETEAAPSRRIRNIVINAGIVLGGIAIGAGFGAIFMNESHPGPRLLLTEHVIPVSWSVDDCPANWRGVEVNPVALARAFRLVDPLLQHDMEVVRGLQMTGPPTSELSDAEYTRRWGVEHADLALGVRLDDVGDVACERDGKFVATHLAGDTINALEAAEYGIDPLTGVTSLPS